MIIWRQIGDIKAEHMHDVLQLAGSPLTKLAGDVHDASTPHSALCLAMLHVESQYGTRFNANTPERKNYLNLRPPQGDGYLLFQTPIQGIKAWRDRITSPTYKAGIYANTITLEELIHIYAPNSDGNSEAEYVRSIERDLATWGIVPKEAPVVESSGIVFGNVPKPPIEELICRKPYEGAGFYRVAPRQNVGVCTHITDGRGSIDFYHDFFSTGGERATDALVDFVVDRSGRIGMLNDWRGTRAPWANGNKLGMEGDGPAFYQKFGVVGIDQKLVSIEHEGRSSEAWTDIQWNRSMWLDAWLFDQMGVRWDTYPVHQDHGVVTHLGHNEFTDKGGNGPEECPGSYWRNRVTEYQAGVRSIMQKHQTSAVPAPPNAPDPPIDTSPRPFEGFAHGLKTHTDQHADGELYQYLERRFKVAPGRKAQKRVAIGKTQLIVDVLDPSDPHILSAFVTRQERLDWVLDQEGYAYQLNALTPRVALPLKPRT